MPSILLAVACALQTHRSLPPLPKSEASELSKSLAAALADPGNKARSKLASVARDWQAKYDFASLVAALRAGPDHGRGDPEPRGKGKHAEKLTRYGSVLYGFSVTLDDVVYRYGVDIPSKYDARKPVPLLIDPGHGSATAENEEGKAGYLDFYRGQANAAGLSHALIARTEIIEQIGTGGVRGAKPEDQVAAVFDALFRDLCSRFAVDLDHVWVSGLSQTGFWSWELGHQRADRFSGIAPMSAVSIQQRFYLPNFQNLSIYILHGDQDPTCPVAQPRATSKELEHLGARTSYREIAGAAHDIGVWSHLNEGLKWLAERPRDPYPKRIAKNLQTTLQPWCYWARIDQIDRRGPGEAGSEPTATFAAQIDGQRIRIDSKGVKKVTLALASELVDLTQPVVVTWNGKEEFAGLPVRDFARALETALEKVDWRGTFEAFVTVSGGK